MVQFNRGLVQLRLRQLDNARRSLDLASATDPTATELVQARNLTSFDEHAREIASQYSARTLTSMIAQ